MSYNSAILKLMRLTPRCHDGITKGGVMKNWSENDEQKNRFQTQLIDRFFLASPSHIAACERFIQKYDTEIWVKPAYKEDCIYILATLYKFLDTIRAKQALLAAEKTKAALLAKEPSVMKKVKKVNEQRKHTPEQISQELKLREELQPRLAILWADAFAKVNDLAPELQQAETAKLQKSQEKQMKAAIRYSVEQLDHKEKMRALRNEPRNYFFWTSAPEVGADCFKDGLKANDGSALFLLDLFFQSVPKVWGSAIPDSSIFENAPPAVR